MTGALKSWLRVAASAARAQVRFTRNDVEDLRPVLTMPLVTVVGLAILVHSQRSELASYALVAASLMTIGQMGLFVASEVIWRERHDETLELVVATPAPYVAVLMPRVLVLTLIGLVGFGESWAIARLLFAVDLTVHHPLLLVATLIASCFGSAGTAVLTAGLFSMGQQIRTFQNAVNGPLYLLGGVLVPTAFLPFWMQWLSPFVFFSWSATLLRAAFSPDPPRQVWVGLSAIVGLGVAAALLGSLVIARMLKRLRQTGTLGLA
ncbi:MAG: type transporter [Myxococcaceae bacterium]|nr:type transporter [Myxococcaceae bacterium]